MRIILGFLLCQLAWGAAYTSKATACAPGPCNWSAAGSWNEGAVPGNGDTVSIADTHKVLVDQNITIGTSVNAYLSYIQQVIITPGTGYTTCTTATWTGGTPILNQQTMENGDRWPITGSGAACKVVSGGLFTQLLTPRKWYSAVSVAPTGTLTGATGTGAGMTAIWQQGSSVAAINLSASGQLIIAPSITLRVRGTIGYTAAAANSTIGVVMQAGSKLIFDSSQAPNISGCTYGDYRCKPIYSYGPISGGSQGKRAFDSSACTVGARCTVTSDPIGNVGSISSHSVTWAGPVNMAYTDFLRMGDGSMPAIDAYIQNTDVYTDWSITHCTFTNSGAIAAISGGGTAHITINDNVFSSPASRSHLETTINTNITTGLASFSRNVFEGSMGPCVSNGPIALRGASIDDNYFGDLPCIMNTSTTPWLSFKRNFIRQFQRSSNSQSQSSWGDIYDSYWLSDNTVTNWHVTTQANDGNGTISGNIAGTTEHPDIDSGEFDLWTGGTCTALCTHRTANNILLPSSTGYGFAEIKSLTGTGPTNVRMEIDHNTVFLGFPIGTNGFGLIQVNETNVSPTGVIVSNRANIAWNPELVGYTNHKPFYVVKTILITTLNADVDTPANSDYNWKWHHTNTQTCTDCINQGVGYVAKYSVLAGTSGGAGYHDKTGDPQFIDWQRNVELFDSKFLGNNPAAWISGRSYNAGDFVSTVDQTAGGVYWGLSVNFRCTPIAPATTCIGTNKPGVPGTAWRGDGWEWASLYRLRTAIAAGETYTLTGTLATAAPTTCNIAASTPICRMMAWVRAGYAPSAPLAAASYPGDSLQYVGAVPWTAANSGNAMFPMIWSMAYLFN